MEPKKPLSKREIENIVNALNAYPAQVQDLKVKVDGNPNPQSEAEIKAERNRRMSLCDYVVLPDSQASVDCKAAFEVYRQALRDLTEQEGYPEAVEWPVEPDYEKAIEEGV